MSVYIDGNIVLVDQDSIFEAAEHLKRTESVDTHYAFLLDPVKSKAHNIEKSGADVNKRCMRCGRTLTDSSQTCICYREFPPSLFDGEVTGKPELKDTRTKKWLGSDIEFDPSAKIITLQDEYCLHLFKKHENVTRRQAKEEFWKRTAEYFGFEIDFKKEF